MEIVCVVARDNDENFNKYLIPSVNKSRLKVMQVGDKPSETTGEVDKKSTCQKYHIAADIIKNQNVGGEDGIIVFVHEDVNIVDNLFKEKINHVFATRPDVGVVGVVGAEILDKGESWLDSKNNPVGHQVYGTNDGHVGKGDYIQHGSVGFYDRAVVVDSSMFAVRASLLKGTINIDNDTLKDDINVYAMDVCLQALKGGMKVAVADILTYHMSKRSTSPNETLDASIDKLMEKHSDLELPITIDSFEFDESEVIDVEI